VSFVDFARNSDKCWRSCQMAFIYLSVCSYENQPNRLWNQLCGERRKFFNISI